MRYVAKDDNWMSPMYGQDIAVVSTLVLGTANRTGPPETFDTYVGDSRFGFLRYRSTVNDHVLNLYTPPFSSPLLTSPLVLPSLPLFTGTPVGWSASPKT